MALENAARTVSIDVFRDVTYRETPEGPLELDVYRPEADEPRPAVVYVHGGAWRQGSRGGYARWAADFAERGGYVGVDVDYRLSGQATFPAQIADVTAAIRWVRANADECGVDPDRIATMGHSAGAHLAALAAVTDDERYDENSRRGVHPRRDVPSTVQATVGLSGLYDFTVFETDPEVHRQLFGGTREDVPALYRAASPRQRVRPDVPPTLLVHGTDDDHVDAEQSVLYRERLVEAGADAELFLAEGGDHVFLYRDEWIDEVRERAGFFLEDHL